MERSGSGLGVIVYISIGGFCNRSGPRQRAFHFGFEMLDICILASLNERRAVVERDLALNTSIVAWLPVRQHARY